MGKLVLMTGGEGYVGSLLRPELGNYQIFCNTYDLVKGENILSTGRLLNVLRSDKYDAVIHLAGYRGPEAFMQKLATEEDYRRVNYVGSETVLRCAHEAGVKRLVFASSNDVYGLSVGRSPNFVHDKTPYPPNLSIYGKLKLKTELLFKKTAEELGMVVISLRLGGIEAQSAPWRLSKHNLGRAFKGAIETDLVKGFEWFNIADEGCAVDISKAKRLLNY